MVTACFFIRDELIQRDFHHVLIAIIDGNSNYDLASQVGRCLCSLLLRGSVSAINYIGPTVSQASFLYFFLYANDEVITVIIVISLDNDRDVVISRYAFVAASAVINLAPSGVPQ